MMLSDTSFLNDKDSLLPGLLVMHVNAGRWVALKSTGLMQLTNFVSPVHRFWSPNSQKLVAQILGYSQVLIV